MEMGLAGVKGQVRCLWEFLSDLLAGAEKAFMDILDLSVMSIQVVINKHSKMESSRQQLNSIMQT